MNTKTLKPREALNKAFLKVKLSRNQIENFKANLRQLLNTINDEESEEFHKNIVSDFLKNTYYAQNHFINTKGRNDLVIHNGINAQSSVGVILEIKKPTNKAEMVSKENLNTKAFHELLLYYLRERITHKNIEIKHLIATNINEWFIFDATLFERLFAQNKELVKQFNTFENSRLKTSVFYEDIAKPFIAKLDSEIELTYFNIQDYQRLTESDDAQLIALFKILSPEHLLGLFANDSNSIDKRFYTELLHIIGLTEIKAGSKKLIERNKEEKRNSGSLLEDTILQLESMDKLSRLEKLHLFGNNHEDQLFNIALELSLTWINRILFLKLLEAQLISYHKGNKSYSFLNQDKIKSYNDLNELFFQVLAKKYHERHQNIKQLFEKVPYLNSSLFESTELEQKTLFISNLKNNQILPLFSQTILKDFQEKKVSFSTLEYLFRFLNAYDFSSEGTEEIQEENKTLISASVLGLIFEKINGYKDGSYFTPSFITMYMSRETLRKAVVQKFNEVKGWNCTDLDCLYDRIEIEDRVEANAIINSLKICDPAVGSGHFLVSVLNEIIVIKNELKILLDRKGRRLKEYQIEVVNDELIVIDEDCEFFKYNPRNTESQRVQETLFHEKQTIIENCLFGVDINPNSVKICRLRLWIELLKNAYYKNPAGLESCSKNQTELETLPNIDINIKCGNSLVSRFPIDVDLGQLLKEKKWTIESYRLAVNTYRNAQNKEQKRAMEKLIADIKSDFRTEIHKNDPKVKKLQNLKGELHQLQNQKQLLEMGKKEKAHLDKQQLVLSNEINKLENEIEEIKTNQTFENAFEWRFEFPEVLNENGDFIGFDVVIGNPPYGVSIKGIERKHLINSINKVPDFEIYYWFIDRAYQILKDSGITSYIIPNSIIFNVYAQEYRIKLFDKWDIQEILDCTEIKIFEDATVRNIIFHFVKNIITNNLSYKATNHILSFNDLSTRPIVSIKKNIAESNNQNWGLIFKLPPAILEILKRIKSNSIPLINLFPETSQGLIAYDKYKGQSEEVIENRIYHHFSNPNNNFKKWLYGEDVVRYKISWNNKEFIDYCDGIANPREPKYFLGNRLLIREITNPSIFSAITNEEFYHDPSIIIVKENEASVFSLESLLAILNSKFATFYHFNSSPKATKGAFPKILVCDVNNFPLPSKLTEEQNEYFKSLVEQILSIRRENATADTTALENEIDQLIYQLYDLTEEEIKIIEENI